MHVSAKLFILVTSLVKEVDFNSLPLCQFGKLPHFRKLSLLNKYLDIKISAAA